MLESIEEVKAQVQLWLDQLPINKNATDYAKGQVKALTEVLRLITPEPRTAETVVNEVIHAKAEAKIIVERLDKEGFLQNRVNHE